MKSGTPITVSNLPHYMYIVCCDCKLTHLFVFEKHKQGFKMRAYRDDYATDKCKCKVRKVRKRRKAKTN